MGSAEGRSPFAGSLRVSLRYNFPPLPATKGARGTVERVLQPPPAEKEFLRQALWRARDNPLAYLGPCSQVCCDVRDSAEPIPADADDDLPTATATEPPATSTPRASKAAGLAPTASHAGPAALEGAARLLSAHVGLPGRAPVSVGLIVLRTCEFLPDLQSLLP